MIKCNKCGDEPDGSPMPKAGEPCGRDLSEEVGHEPGTFICKGTYQRIAPPTVKLFVVQTIHDGTDMGVRRATPEEVAEELEKHEGWAMPIEDARELARARVRETNEKAKAAGVPNLIPMRWFDFSEEP